RSIRAGRRSDDRPARLSNASASGDRLELPSPSTHRAVPDSVLPGRLLGRRVESHGQSMMAGAAIFAVAAATCLVAPTRLNLILTIDSPGANHVIVPVVYWAAVVIAAALIARAD